MAFKNMDEKKRKPQLHSLIDMTFILLLFFLVTSMIAQLAETEQKLAIPTPENKPGRAQILLQFIDENQVLFLDESASSIVDYVENLYGFRSEEFRKGQIIRMLFSDKRFMKSKAELLQHLTELKSTVRERGQSYFILIRCPDDLPYYHVIDVIQTISDESNLQYGCVGGSIDDIQGARRIYLRQQSENGVLKDNLYIDF
ncbi:hypothetical protein EH223_01310 [candidate division KSB1 bacterium]|nr:biopolymer transporter ExbD [candidate division KSB1 bacterium]RQW06840.1 MAG: hypothetical protein EH223_01310 [candidate division KSB1 bacterium]